MKHLSFKILVLCVLFPPLLNIVTIHFLERYFKASYTRQVQAAYTGNTKLLFEGAIQLKDAIQQNIDAFLKRKIAPRWGLKVIITVSTKEGGLLFPATFESSAQNMMEKTALTIAIENFHLLSKGLELEVDTIIEYDTPISLLILLLFILASVSILSFFYRKGMDKINIEEMRRLEEISRLMEKEKKSKEQVEKLERQKEKYSEQLNKLEKQTELYSEQLVMFTKEMEENKHKALATEDELVEELVKKEGEIEKIHVIQRKQLDEIADLKEKIELLENDLKKMNRPKKKESDSLTKRFTTLYKNISVNDRAIEGYLELPEELKIKAEEIIHQLNSDPQLVTIKRKVFGKKNRETVLEVLFAYKGRLYFRNTSQKGIEVLVIGTKQTQDKDLYYLNNL